MTQYTADLDIFLIAPHHPHLPAMSLESQFGPKMGQFELIVDSLSVPLLLQDSRSPPDYALVILCCRISLGKCRWCNTC